MRVDAHVHLWDVHQGAVPTSYPVPVVEATSEDLLQHMASEGVERAVLVQPQVHASDHGLLSRALAAHPGRFVGFGLVDADAESANACVDAVLAVAELGLAGVRVHLVGGAGRHAASVATAASRQGLAVELHVDQAGWTRMEPIIEAAGERLVVIDHLGRPVDPRSRRARDTLRLLAARPNVTLKLAALDVVSRSPFPHEDVVPLIAAAVDVFGPERLMWGSNFPWSRGEQYGASLRVLARLGLPDAACDAVLGETAGRLFFADPDRAVV